MQYYSKTLSTFLNDIEQHIPELVNETCGKVLSNAPEIIKGMPSTILYGNNKMYLNIMATMVIKKMFNLPNLRKSTSSFSFVHQGSSVDVEYEHSDYHFEMDYSDKHVKFIKSIISNKRINDRPFIFVIKGLDETSAVQTPLKQVIDGTCNAHFILLAKNLSKVDKTIKSRSMMINGSFDIHRVYRVVTKYTTLETPFEVFHSMYEMTNHSIVSVIMLMEFGVNQNIRLYHHMDLLLARMKKEKNALSLIEAIREFVYKVYHMTIPLDTLTKYIINKFKVNNDVISLAAQCSLEFHKSGNKTILAYERFFMNLPAILPK